jgi:hypothetical protein
MFTSPSGGLTWHWRAWRHRALWRDFMQALQTRLVDWCDTLPAPTEGLLLLGPSAGWTLPGQLLRHFSHIHAVDLDALAPQLFAWVHRQDLQGSAVHPSPLLTWERCNLMDELPRLLAQHPRHAVLFVNMLGQHRFHQAQLDRTESELQQLKQQLRAHAWASYHDRLSGQWPTALRLPAAFTHAGPVADAQLAQAMQGYLSQPTPWLDHLTAEVLPHQSSRLLLPWRIRPGWLHWVEVGSG